MAQVPPLRVPQRTAPALTDIALLGPEEQDALVLALSDPAPVVTPRALIARIAEAVPGADEDVVKQLVSGIFAISGLANSHEWPASEVAASVADSSELELEGDARAALARILESGLLGRATAALAKAVDVGAEHERLYHVARVMTDLRPVFLDAAEGPAGLVLTHTLKFDYYNEGDVHGTEFVLSEQDLQSLLRVLERASVKASSLREALGASGLQLFDLAEE